MSVTEVPFAARVTSIGTHWRSIAFRRVLGVAHGLFTSCIPALGLTPRRGVGVGTPAK
jgi:hypothetical protein